MKALPTRSRKPSGWRRLARSGLFGSLGFDIRLRGLDELLNVIVVLKGTSRYVHHLQRGNDEVNVACPAHNLPNKTPAIEILTGLTRKPNAVIGKRNPPGERLDGEIIFGVRIAVIESLDPVAGQPRGR